MSFTRTCILVACATVALAQPDEIAENAALKTLATKLQATEETVVSMPKPAGKYAQACWQNAHLRIKRGAASLLQNHNVPGAGIDKFKPFEKVLKDGFLPVDCVKDYMYYRGDKFGDNKHDYKLGQRTKVSIVHFDAFVAKEDQGEMTQKKCFEFCRTVPNMGFFGVVNGRGCYCTPYYQAMESDKSQCDSVCEGEHSTMCGGESKSSVFAMHMCDSTAEDLGKLSGQAKRMVSSMRGFVTEAKSLSSDMQVMAAQLQKRFGAVGDSGATALLQNAKVFAGDLVHKAEEATVATIMLGKLSTSASKLKGFGSPATVTKAERLMEDIGETIAKVDVVHDELATLEAWAVGEHEARESLLHQPDGGEDGSAAAPFVSKSGHKKVGKDGYYMLGPWFNICGKEQMRKNNKAGLSQKCTEEKCGPIAIEKKECQGYFETWTASDHALCYCRTARDFDESQMMKYDSAGAAGAYKVETWKYPIPNKLPSALDQYYPVMYFVDKEFQEVPTTCNGNVVAKPVTGQSADSCAASCDSHIHSCVAFQFFKDGRKTMCFLFSKFSTGVYYTGCGKSFLQSDAAPFEAKCYAKLSKFVGTTLKPNPSGKCDECFKDLTKAERCYK